MDDLFDRSVTLHETDEDTGLPQVSKTRSISKASYIEVAGRIKVIFTADVIKYITRLEKEFTSYQLEKVGNMTAHMPYVSVSFLPNVKRSASHFQSGYAARSARYRARKI
jgi:plasmid replication initiation protein